VDIHATSLKRERAGRFYFKPKSAALSGLCLLLACGLMGCSRNSTFLDPQGPVAAAQRQLFFDVIGWMMIVVVPVFVLVPLFAWRYRRKNSAAPYRPQWSFSLPLEFAVWGIPIAIVAILGSLIWSRATPLDPYVALPSENPPLDIQVVGLDWKWLFIYPEQHIATVGIAAFPADRPVHLSLTSDTVMQSFFIPALGSQIYAMAGMVTQLNLSANATGNFDGKNTQFNGDGFQKQRFTASAMEPQAFLKWVAMVRSQGKPLDDEAYRRLSAAGTAEMAQRRLGMTGMPPSILYFSTVGPTFFDNIVSKYRGQASVMHAPPNR
jgi:cytochrome o ubiquinol oxidase subunit II